MSNKIADFIVTLTNLKRTNTSYIWSGEFRHSYTRELFKFGKDNNILKLEYIESDQESGYNIIWLKEL